jgi:hypothetical protein
MSVKQKERPAVKWLLLLLGFSFLAGGCSGIHASKSFSPLDFLLPGLGATEPTEQPGTTKPALTEADTPVRLAANDSAF